jgi:hypothetical protein
MHRISFRKPIVPILMILAILLASCAPLAEHTVPETFEPDIEESPSITEDTAPTEASEEDPIAVTSNSDGTEPIAPETEAEEAIGKIVEENSDDPTPTMPFITEEHQGFTYGPGQRVVVIAEGFEPGGAVAVTLFHQEQGQLDAFSIDPIDNRGKTPIYHTVDGSYPDGTFHYHISGSNGVEKTYTFALDHSQVVESVPFEGCGVYPEPVLGSTVIAWCTGFTPEDEPVVVRGLVDGEELFSDDDTLIWGDGVVTYLLDIFEDDPAGEWTLEMGEKETFTFDIGATHD